MRSAALVRAVCLLVVCQLCLTLPVRSVRAEGIRLKNEMLFEGRAVRLPAVSKNVPPDAGGVTVYPITMIDAGMQRYYFRTQDIIGREEDSDVGREIFRLPNRAGRGGRVLGAVGLFKSKPFNEFGRRSVQIQTSKGPLQVDQGISRIGPKYMQVAAKSLAWEFGIATESIPISAVDTMIRKVTDQTKPEDRFAIARFYLQANRYPQALAELNAIGEDFSDLKDRAEDLALQAQQLFAQQLLDELGHRRAAGQHRLAYFKAKQFPAEGMSAAILRQVREFLGEYEGARDEGELVLALLGEMQAELEDGEQRQAVDAMRVEISQKLNYETLSRLRPFLQQSDDPTRSPSEKLGLAYSGWVLGSAQAVPSLEKAINLWDARFEIIRYLRTQNSVTRTQVLADLTSIEGVGPETVKNLIPFLPPLIDSRGVQPGVATEVLVDKVAAGASADAPDVRYHVLLPTEYSPDRTYPVVVALHSVERDPKFELRWWGGTREKPLQSQRNGYIVIAPDYEEEGEKTYSYSPMCHYRVLMAIRDARKRFSVDSDRVIVSGHGSGGDAAFDMGFRHPDVFAGAIPITGVLDNVDIHLRDNGRYLPWYIVGGELDRDTFDRNARHVDYMMKKRYDVIMTEYIGRGYESYYSEIHRLFEWMDTQRRMKFPQDFSVEVVHPNNNRFFWLKCNTIPDSARVRQVGLQAAIGRPKTISAKILSGRTEYTSISISSPSRTNTLWLAPEMIDFERRLQVRVGSQRKYNDFIEASVETILEDVRLRGDRQKIYQAKIELN